MMDLTINEIALCCGAAYYGPEELRHERICAVTIDSRTVSAGSMFAALAGERTDGHRFIPMAFEKGAVCVLAERVPEQTVPGVVLVVQDVRAALQTAAAYYRSKFDIPFVGVTGSVGKTTAKEMVAAVLGEKFCVHKTAANLNNELGVPLTLFALKKEHTAAVVEMGISDFGEMRRLAAMVKPDYAIFTTIGDAHLEFLGDRAGVLRAKSEMLEHMSAEGCVLINGDDAVLKTLSCPQKQLRFGLGDDCDVRAEELLVDEKGEISCCIVSGEHRLSVKIPAYGDHMVYAALEAAALAIELGLSDSEIIAGIGKYETVGHRGRVIRKGQQTIVDDCYNANPTSVESAIRSLRRLPGRHVCILGDMLELGEESAMLHAACGRFAREQGIELLLCCGDLSRSMAEAAGDAAVHFESRQALIDALPKLLQPDDCILVKASHSMRFEEIVAAIEHLNS